MANPIGTATRRRSATALIVACALVAVCLVSQASPSSAVPDAAESRAVPGELLIGFKSGVAADLRATLRAEAGVVLKRRLLVRDVELVRTLPGVSVAAAIAALEADPRVRYAEPNRRYELQSIPDDPRFSELDPAGNRVGKDQWGLFNTGQTIEDFPGTPGADISATEAWSLGESARGSRSVKVAIIDNGGDYFHPDLAANIWTNPAEAPNGDTYNGADDDQNGISDDIRGWDFLGDDPEISGQDATSHGTAMAGIVGAVGNNGIGMTGVNWRVSLIPLRACTGLCDLAAAADAAAYAGRIDADVVNMSFGGSTHDSTLRNAIRDAPETLFVAGAGNDSRNLDQNSIYPCEFDLANVICVAATNNRDELWPDSNYGANSVDLAAPGDGILAPQADNDLTPAFDEKFRDDFELPTPRWDYEELPIPPSPIPTKWRRVALGGTSGHVLDDSELTGYQNNADIQVKLLNPIDLRGEHGCFVTLQAGGTTEPGKDFLHLEAATASDGPYAEIARLSGDTSGRRVLVSGQLPRELDDRADVYLRLRLSSDGANGDSGVTVDDVVVRCQDAASSYGFRSGTSDATPHVAGAAALLKSYMPGLTVAQLRERLLLTVDKLPSLAGKVITGGRLDLHRALTADLTRPATTITARPAAVTNSRSATFAFSASKAGSSFACRLDGDEFSSCASQRTYADLSDGAHTFAVRATDEYGIVGPVAEAAWTVDATTPTVTITSGPAASTTARTAAFEFSASEPAERFECAIDGAAFAACTSPASYDDLAPGQHAFHVRARDAAGNWSVSPAARSWTVTEVSSEQPPLTEQPSSGVEGDRPADPIAEQPPTGGADPVLVPPDPGSGEPQAFPALPELAVKLRAGQTVERALRGGIGAIGVTTAECPCQIVFTLGLDRRLARSVGLLPRRATTTARPTVARLKLALAAPGNVRAKLVLSRKARRRLARVTRLRGTVEATLTDRFDRTAAAQVRLRIER